ncbi:MAG: general secretion pathway protein GspK [Methylibium sp. NZG]|nr:MAG: general secretion pathway protein GspK [Methylibium sp. NZG]
MIIVTLVVTLAAGMVWQQWRAVQVEAAERSRTQSAWILGGALDWARLILREDARSARPTALSEPWAVPLAEARLSTFLAADKDNADDAPDAFLSGAIADAQARYNLRNLVGPDLKLVPTELAALERLCQAVGISSDVSTRVAEGLRNALASASATSPLLPRSVSQLSWLGLDPQTVRALEPYVVLLPKPTSVNVNTAAREVLVAGIKGLDLATAERLVQVRSRTPFKTLQEVEAQVPGLSPLPPQQLGVVSTFFEVSGRLRLGDRVLEQRSLVERRGIEVVALQREQVSSRGLPGGP